MEQNKRTLPYPLIGGILFLVLAFLQLLTIVSYFSVAKLLYLVAYVVTAMFMIMKRRDIIACAGIGSLALASLIGLIVVHGSIIYILEFLSCLGMGVLALACFTDYLTPQLPQIKDNAEKLWFIPAVCIALAVILSLFVPSFAYIIRALFVGLVRIAAMLALGIWVVYADDVPEFMKTANKTVSSAQVNGNVTVTEMNPNAMYYSMALHIVLLLFTLGIWQLIWIYRVTDALNCVQDEPPRNPVTKLLLCMFIPFYIIYWTYKSAQRIDKLAWNKGLTSELATICLILEIFVPIIPPILMQDKMNAISGVTDSAQVHTPAPSAPNANNGAADELKKYKELLDIGAITQEEYDEKKRKLLDL